VPEIILQWRDGWAMEDAIGWILAGAEEDVVAALQSRIACEFTTVADLVEQFKVPTGPGRLKTDYLAYEAVASVIGSLPGCRKRAAALLKAVTLACLGQADGKYLVERDEGHSGDESVVFRLLP
jgi:hypothetical protein